MSSNRSKALWRKGKKKQFRRKLAKEAKKEEEFRVYMIRAKEGKGIPSEISEEGEGKTINTYGLQNK